MIETEEKEIFQTFPKYVLIGKVGLNVFKCIKRSNYCHWERNTIEKKV